MARRKTPTTRVDPAAFDRAGAQVFDNPVKTEIEDSYLEYACSVIHSRALPDARDGRPRPVRSFAISPNSVSSPSGPGSAFTSARRPSDAWRAVHRG
jgi:DNA gyrase subunit A